MLLSTLMKATATGRFTPWPTTPRRSQAAFTLVETVVAMLLLTLVCAGLYGGISTSFQNVQLTREGLRATQITEQTMEVIRLCTWSQSDPGTNFLPASFTAPYDSTGSTNHFFQVQVTVTNAPGVTEVYSNDLRMVTVQAWWTNNNIARTRGMSTYVAKSGLLWYVSY
jgi:Tfp pilus assembly protein PilV